MNYKILAIIPARGGSKGIHKKNIKILKNHPLIAYSINVCKNAHSISRFIVSTDDMEIADIAKHYGAEVPFMRPSEFALDDTPDKPVFVHTLDWLKEKEGYLPDFVLHIRPTAPFRTEKDIESVINIWKEAQCDSVRSVSLIDATSHPYWAYVDKNNWGYSYINDPKIKQFHRRQLLPPLYKANGLVDGYTPHSIYNSEDMLGKKMKLHIIPDKVDIDTIEDFEYAEFLLERKKVKGI